MAISATCHWNEKMNFTAQLGNHSLLMDAKAPIGSDLAPTPKQIVLGALCGCTAMDVVSLMRKHKQNLKSFDIDAEAPTSEGHPSVFTDVQLTFRLEGEVEPAKAKEAVELSMTKYCSVSAMISKNCPIHYKVLVNGTEVHQGQAHF